MIRNDFVSNSSSSSFMVIGYEFDEDTLIELLNKSGQIIKDTDSLTDVLTNLFGSSKLIECYRGISYDDIWYIGANYTSMNYTDTRSDFENRIKEAIDDKIPALKEKDCIIRMYTDGGYDG